jgi:hypothetical protein
MENVTRAAGLADLRDYLEGEKNRGATPAAKQREQQIEDMTTDRWIDIP